MKIELGFYVLAAVFLVDFSLAKNEHKRRRPIIDSAAQDSDGNFIDQIASDSIGQASKNVVSAPENYPAHYLAATEELRKSKKFSSEPKVHYVTPEPYNNNFSQDYVHHALKTHEKSKEPASSFLDYSSLTHDDARKPTAPKKKKLPSSEEDYNYYFSESKRIFSDTKRIAPENKRPIITRTTAKPASEKDTSERYYKPQSAGAVIKKDKLSNGDDSVNTYHYYYPEESASAEKSQQNNFEYPSSTFAPTTTKAPKIKFSSRKKAPSMQHEHSSSTDSYQYPPVLQRPSEYTPTDSHDFLPAYESKHYAMHSTPVPSTSSPIKMLKPTKKNNYYLPSSTMSPSSTIRPHKIRRPSTETPYEDIKQFSVSPSPSSAPHYSTTRAPEVYKYSTPSPVSSTTHGDFYIRPSTQATPSVTPSSGDLLADNSEGRTVVIRPKTHYQNYDNYESHEPMKETIIYKFVPEYYEPNKTENAISHSTRATLSETPDYYRTLNSSTQADMDFYNNFHKSYNYEYFTEQDAGPMQEGDEDSTMKMDHHDMMESEDIDDKQKASKKNMYYSLDADSQANDYMGEQSSMMPMQLQDREVPPPMGDVDNDAEASKNQYFVLYSVDEEEKKQKKRKPKPKQEPEVIYHHHQHQHEEKGEDFHNFDSEFDSEFDSDVTNTDNVRIVDPSVRGGRPIEFTKDDYLRHIKQAVVQYMKEYQPKDSTSSSSNGNVKLKNQRLQESSLENAYRPSKSSSAATTQQAYRHTISPQQYKPMAQMKLPKNVYTAGRLKDAIDDLQESPQVDLTVKKNKQKPFDLSAIDVGQSYQHVSQFDHSAALKHVEEFDQSNVVQNQQTKPKLHFSQQTYHDINNLSYNQKQKQHQQQTDDSDNDAQTQNLYKGYMLPNKYKGSSTYSSMNYDSSKLPRIVSQHGQDDDDEDDNKVDDPVDAPIQIINGIPVANPYNIDLNTLKYMLGGIAQAEVNDQLKDLDESASQNHKFPSNWKSYAPNQMGSYTSHSPVYQVFGQESSPQRHKKNSGQSGNHGNNNHHQQLTQHLNQQMSQQQNQQQQKFPLVGSLVNYNKGKNQNQNQNGSNKQRNSHNNNQNQNSHRNNHKSNDFQNFGIQDYSGWNQVNKKQRSEPQAASSNSQIVLRPVLKNKQARDERLHMKGSINRIRAPQLSVEMRPPPPIMPKTHLRLTKVL